MILDARQPSATKTLQADVIVAGAGPAGIALSLTLANSGADVILLESGGRHAAPDTQSLYKGRNLGLPYHDLDSCRVRALGGSSHKWGGFLKPPEPRDFEPVPGVPLSEWPLSFEDIRRHLLQATEFLHLRPGTFDARERFRSAGFDPGNSTSPDTDIRLFHRLSEKERHFGSRFEKQLADNRNLRVLLHANVSRITLEPDTERVASIEYRTLSGLSFHARADFYVLACHGIENARLLLDSDNQLPSGLGNRSGLLGRCFMDHAALTAGLLQVKNRDRFPEHLVLDSERDFSACLTINQEVTDAESTLQYFFRLAPLWRQPPGAGTLSPGLGKLRQPYPATWQKAVATVLDTRRSGAILRSRLGLAPSCYVLNHRIEQAPDPASRIVLSNERDRLGNRRAYLDWRLSDTDLRSFRVGQAITTRWMRELGLGTLYSPEITKAFLDRHVTTYWHHMGTTRMSSDENKGVVDPNCRVHGVDNLFVAGSSVFCRGALSPPTLLIMALALRLADHLLKRFGN